MEQSKAEELASEIADYLYKFGKENTQSFLLVSAAQELRRLSAIEAERDALRAEVECLRAAPALVALGEPVATTYVNERGDEVSERRSRSRDGDDPRIARLFNGFDCRIESAQINFDKYAEGYLLAMRAEFAGLVADLHAAPAPVAAYDQQALELCADCGWKARTPDVCLMCQHQAAPAPVAQGPAYHVTVSGRLYLTDPTPLGMALPDGRHALYTHPAPAPVAQPLTDEALMESYFVAWFGLVSSDTFTAIVRWVERAHGIEATGQEGGA